MEHDHLPAPIAKAYEAMTAEASRLASGRSKYAAQGVHFSHEALLASTTRAIDLLSDARALLTAYLHAVASPRPKLTQIAAAQHVSPSSLRHRYSAEQAEAAERLAQLDPQLDRVLGPYPAMEDHHLLMASDSDNYSDVFALRSELRIKFFHFADRMEDTERSYSDNLLFQLCFNHGWTYAKASDFIASNSENEDAVLVVLERQALFGRHLPNESHPGYSRRLISEYPRGMMLEALRDEPPTLLEFYKTQTRGA